VTALNALTNDICDKAIGGYDADADEASCGAATASVLQITGMLATCEYIAGGASVVGVAPADATCLDLDGEHAYPHRVFVWVICVLPVVYAVLISLLILLYKGLRSGKANGYAEAMAQGEIYKGGDGNESDDGEGRVEDVANNWITASIDDVRTENGLDAALYLLHNKHMGLFCLMQFLGMGLPMCMVYWQTGEEPGLSMYSWSYANLKKDNLARFLPVLMSYAVIASTVGLLVYKQRVMESYKDESAAEREFSAGNAVWVKGLPAKTEEDTVRKWLDDGYGKTLIDCRLVWDVNLLGHNLRARRRCINKINELVLKDDDEKAPMKIDTLAAQVKTLESLEPALRKKDVVCAGSAFVTFTTSAACRTFRSDIADSAVKDAVGQGVLGVQNWTTEMAPRPAEIYWENFGLDGGAKFNNNLKSLGATLAMFGLFLCISLCAVWCIGYLYMDIIYQVKPIDAVQDILHPMQDAVTPYVWYGLITPVLLGLFLFLEEEMAPVIKFISKYELPLTKSHKQSSFLGKCYFFYLIYHLLLSTVLLGVLAATVKVAEDMPGGAQKLYVESIGMFHQNRCFLTACVIDMMHVMEGLSFFTRSGHTLTLEEEEKFDGAEDEDDDEDKIKSKADDFFNDKFSFSRNYGEGIGVFTSICYYQVMHPTILLCGAFYYFIKLYVDKYQITNQYTRPHIQYGRRARSTSIYILTAMTFGQIGNVVWFCFLADDMLDVGVLMCGSLFISICVLATYVIQPAFFKKRKAKTKMERTASKDAELAQVDDLDQDKAMAIIARRKEQKEKGDGGYHPPHPDKMSVGVSISPSSPSLDVAVSNPMLDSDRDEVE
jgi:hypothetical protein